MLSKSRISTLFLYTMIAIAIAFAPLLIGRLHRNVDPLETMRSEKPQWVGVIEMWNTCYVKASKGSQVTWLENEAIQAFEYKNQGVYIRTISVDQNKIEYELERSQASGNLPDIVSIPAEGKGDFEDITFEDNTNVLSNKKIKKTIKNDGIGIPWAVGGYVYMVNKDLCDKLNLPIIDHTKILTVDHPYSQIDGVKSFLFPIGCKEQIVEKMNSNQLSAIDYVSDSDYYRMFLKNNQSVAAIVPLRTYFMAITLQSDGKINQFESQRSPEWIENNQICRLGLIQQNNESKKELCFKFLNHLLSDDVQQQVERLGLFSVKEDIKTYDTGLLADIEQMYR